MSAYYSKEDGWLVDCPECDWEYGPKGVLMSGELCPECEGRRYIDGPMEYGKIGEFMEKIGKENQE